MEVVAFHVRGVLVAFDARHIIEVRTAGPLSSAAGADGVAGVVPLHGAWIPVLVPSMVTEVVSHLLLVRLGADTVAIGIPRSPQRIVLAPTLVESGETFCGGVLRLADGSLYVHDLSRFLADAGYRNLGTLARALETLTGRILGG